MENDGECGYTAAGIGNALTNIEHGKYDEEKKRKARQALLGKKEKIGKNGKPQNANNWIRI